MNQEGSVSDVSDKRVQAVVDSVRAQEKRHSHLVGGRKCSCDVCAAVRELDKPPERWVADHNHVIWADGSYMQANCYDGSSKASPELACRIARLLNEDEARGGGA